MPVVGLIVVGLAVGSAVYGDGVAGHDDPVHSNDVALFVLIVNPVHELLDEPHTIVHTAFNGHVIVAFVQPFVASQLIVQSALSKQLTEV